MGKYEEELAKNPILVLLCRRRRNIKLEDIASVISALANMDKSTFTLRELDRYLPEDLKRNKNKRRSVSTLLETLVEIGYLGKPSERRWAKKHQSLSQYLSSSLFDLATLERRRVAEAEKELRIIKTQKVKAGVRDR